MIFCDDNSSPLGNFPVPSHQWKLPYHSHSCGGVIEMVITIADNTNGQRKSHFWRFAKISWLVTPPAERVMYCLWTKTQCRVFLSQSKKNRLFVVRTVMARGVCGYLMQVQLGQVALKWMFAHNTTAWDKRNIQVRAFAKNLDISLVSSSSVVCKHSFQCNLTQLYLH